MADELVINWQNVAPSSAPRGVVAWSIDSDYFVATDGWTVTFLDREPARLQGLELEPVEFLLGGTQQMLGRVDSTRNSGDGRLEVSGRDYLADISECNIDPTFAVKKNEALGFTISGAAAPCGIRAVVSDSDAAMRNVRTGASVGAPSKKTFSDLRLSDFKPSPGQSIYDFLNRICARHGCTMQPGSQRNTIVLSAPHYDQPAAYSISRSRNTAASASNVVVRATATRDYSSFPTYTHFVGKSVGTSGSATNVAGKVPIADYLAATDTRTEMQAIVNERAIAGRVLPKDGQETNGQLYRLLYHRDEAAKNKEQLERAAWRAIGERMKETLVYEVTMKGHRDPASGRFWAVDTICQVDDEMAGVHEPLWILSRRFSYDGSADGERTSLRMIRPYSIVLEVEV